MSEEVYDEGEPDESYAARERGVIGDAFRRMMRVVDSNGKASPAALMRFFSAVAIWEESDLNLLKIAVGEGMREALIRTDMREATAWSDIAVALARHPDPSQMMTRLSELMILDEAEEGEEKLPPASPTFEVTKSQVFYVRSILARGLAATLDNVIAGRHVLNKFGDDIPGFLKMSIEGSTKFSQQLFAEAVKEFGDLPDEIRPELDEYQDVTPFGELPERHASKGGEVTLKEIEGEIERLKKVRARILATGASEVLRGPELKKHIEEFLVCAKDGDCFSPAQVAAFRSSQYPNGDAAAGAVAARLFPPDGKPIMPGYRITEAPNGHAAIRVDHSALGPDGEPSSADG
ncbi:hypothetical protein AB0F25_30385 [Streptomyces wedmorensis]|uniref:hypothetical protein n=1 Tax=Streptomyces wedmorensis TaxID=43759 RepID=UPI0034253544